MWNILPLIKGSRQCCQSWEPELLISNSNFDMCLLCDLGASSVQINFLSTKSSEALFTGLSHRWVHICWAYRMLTLKHYGEHMTIRNRFHYLHLLFWGFFFFKVIKDNNIGLPKILILLLCYLGTRIFKSLLSLLASCLLRAKLLSTVAW